MDKKKKKMIVECLEEMKDKIEYLIEMCEGKKEIESLDELREKGEEMSEEYDKD